MVSLTNTRYVIQHSNIVMFSSSITPVTNNSDKSNEITKQINVAFNHGFQLLCNQINSVFDGLGFAD